MAEFDVISEQEWERLPGRKPTRPPDAWDEVLDLVEAGKIVRITTQDEKDLKGKRIGLGRRAISRGFKLEYRTEGTTLAVRRSEKPLPERQDGTPEQGWHKPQAQPEEWTEQAK